MEITPSIIEGIYDRKGSFICIVELEAIETAPTTKFIICQGRNPIQVAAIADSVRDRVLSDTGRKPDSTDGYNNREWIILDYGEVILHIFLPEARTRYALEELYADAPCHTLPDHD